MPSNHLGPYVALLQYPSIMDVDRALDYSHLEKACALPMTGQKVFPHDNGTTKRGFPLQNHRVGRADILSQGAT